VRAGLAVAALAGSAAAGYLGAGWLDDPPAPVAPSAASPRAPATDETPTGPTAPGPLGRPVEPAVAPPSPPMPAGPPPPAPKPRAEAPDPRPPPPAGEPEPPAPEDVIEPIPDEEPPLPEPPSPPVLRPPLPPPLTLAVAPGEAPTGHLAARRILARRLTRARPGSRTAADLRHALALARRFLVPRAGVPEGRRRTIARALAVDAWWYSRWPAPGRRALVRDADGILHSYRPGHGFAVNPVATTGRWHGLNADVGSEDLAEALLELGVARRAGSRRFLVWEYYDLADAPGAIAPGASGMAQARVAVLLAHAWARTGDARFAAASRGALGAFTVDVDRGGVRSAVAFPAGSKPSPWYVERAYPGASPWKGGALNGFMVSLLNLRGVAALLSGPADAPPPEARAKEHDGAPAAGPEERADAGPARAAIDAAGIRAAARLARTLADRGAGSLARFLPLHDSGSWSYYGLLTPGRPWRSYLADLNYHCYHVRLLRQLDAVYPGRGFAEAAGRWESYVDALPAQCPEP